MPNFPKELTTTKLSVDDLVQRCHAAGYIKDGGAETVAHSNSGSLTMAVQPTSTTAEGLLGVTEAGNGMQTDASEQNTNLPPLTPTELAFEHAMRAAIEEAPAGATSLAEATIAMDNLCSQWPNIEVFDPTAEFEITFDPNIGDAWDAQDLSTTINGDVDWDGLLHFPPT